MDNNIQNNNRFSGIEHNFNQEGVPEHDEQEQHPNNRLDTAKQILKMIGSDGISLGKEVAIKLANKFGDFTAGLKTITLPSCKNAPEKMANFLLDCMAKVIVKSGYSAEAKDFLSKAEKRFDEPGYTRRREGEASSISPHGPPPPIPSREGRPPLGEYSASEAKINSDWRGIKPSKTTRPEQSYFVKSRADHTPEENIGVDGDDSDLDDYLSSSEYFSDDDDQEKNWL